MYSTIYYRIGKRLDITGKPSAPGTATGTVGLMAKKWETQTANGTGIIKIKPGGEILGP